MLQMQEPRLVSTEYSIMLIPRSAETKEFISGFYLSTATRFRILHDIASWVGDLSHASHIGVTFQ